MLTLPTKFADWYYRDGVRWFPILYVTDGTTEWWFSTKDIIMNTGGASPTFFHVYPLILDIAPIRESIDFFTRRSSLTSLSITIVNVPYRINSSGSHIRFSDEITIDFLTSNGIVKLYYACGENIAEVNDCLLVFQGRISEFPSYTREKLTLNAYAELQYNLEQKELPNHTYNDISSGAGTYRPPVIYGDYGPNVNLWHHSNPLIKIKKGTFSGTDKYYFADHLVAGSQNIYWYLPELESYMLIDSSYITVSSDTNRQYVTVNTSTGYVDGYVFLSPDGPATKLFSGASNESVYNDGANLYMEAYPKENTYDRIDSTQGYAIGSTVTYNTRHMSSFQWKDYGAGIDETEFALRYNIDSNNVYLLWKASLNTTDYTYDYAAAPYASCVVAENKNSSVRVVDYTSDIYDGTSHSMILGSEGGSFDFDSHVGWKMATNEFVARLLTHITSYSSFAYTRLKINEVILKIHIRYTIPEGTNFHPEYLYIATAGQSVNSNISSRSGLSTGALLEPAVYQIEMILRNHYDITTSQIDTDTFDYAYDISGGGLGHQYTGRFVFTDETRTNVIEFLQELCENGQIALYFSPTGKAKIVLQNRLGYAPSSYLTIRRADLIEDILIESTGLDKVVNYLTYNYDFNLFTDIPSSGTRQHPDSMAQWGTLALYDIDYKYSPSPDPPVNNSILSSLNLAPLLPIPRLIAKFETPGIKFIHLEIGDYIAFESGLNLSGGYVIFEKTINRNTISFHALEIQGNKYDPS